MIGTVATSEFLVAAGASAGFLIGLNRGEIPFSVVGALLLGGVIAAPLAAWLVRSLHPRVLGTAVGGLIIVTNSRTLLTAAGVSGDARVLALLCLAILWLGALAIALQAVSLERAVTQPETAGD